MSLFFTYLTNNSNLQKAEFDYFKATIVVPHFHRNCILQQLVKDHKFISSNRGSCQKGGGGYLLHIFARETNNTSWASIVKSWSTWDQMIQRDMRITYWINYTYFETVIVANARGMVYKDLRRWSLLRNNARVTAREDWLRL